MATASLTPRVQGRVRLIARVSAVPPLANTIISIADDGGGNPLMTTAAPHGLEGGENIVVSGNSEASYNTTWLFIEVPTSPTEILLATPVTPPMPTGTGGTWALL